jgi:uncharacterized protein YjbI with pentapeptide repeats
MPPCKYHRICGRDALNGEDLCILHSRSPEKDKKAFDEALEEHRKGKGDNFSYFVFPALADFSKTEFKERADFMLVWFRDESRFDEAKFSGMANFTGTLFDGKTRFQETKFNNGAVFSAQFADGAEFNAAQFDSRTSFSSAKFNQSAQASFQHAQFTGKTDFFSSTFGETAFMWARFTGPVEFFHTKFIGKANFAATEFASQCRFINVQFNSGANFHGARFTAQTLIATISELGGYGLPAVFSGGEVDFRDVTIYPLDTISIRNADLGQSRFLGTDLRKAEFVGVKWPKKGGRFRVHDEDAQLSEGQTRAWHDIEHLYRQLKQNYEDRKDYERASDFHYGEKEMRRKNPETSRGLWLLLILYWLVSGYGERWIRPLVWAAALLVVCAILYLFLGVSPKNGGAALAWTSGRDWLESLLYSFRVMTILRPDDLVPVGLTAKFLSAIQSILGPIILGLFALAVRQRLKR